MEAAWQWRRAVWRSKVLKWALEGDENARQPELASVVERLRAAASDTPLFAPVAFELRGGWGSWDDLKAPCAGSQAS